MPASDTSTEWLCQFVLQRSGMLLDPGRGYIAQARLTDLAQREGFSSWEAMIERLTTCTAGPLHDRVVEAMLVRDTRFFRDAHLFEALRTDVLPKLVASRSCEQALHIWSAACSTGQEPYSMLMMMRHGFPHLSRWNVRIMASDLSERLLARAREGIFSLLEVNTGLPSLHLVRSFTEVNAGWQVRPHLRNAVEFFQLNLAERWHSLPQMDLILLRNVLSGLSPAVRSDILSRIKATLRPGGYLILGDAESASEVDPEYHEVALGAARGFQLG